MGIERDDLNRLEDRLTQAMAAGFLGVHTRLDDMDGRTRTNENNIIRMQERFKQTQQAQKPSRWPKIAGFSGIAAMLAEVGKWYFAK
jgi:hypothetical protein